MANLKIAAISYLNSIPFVYGLKKSNISLDLFLDIPSVCAQKFLNGSVDVALVPVAILPSIDQYHIIGDYCIGANGKVETVCLYSDVPLEKIDTILLDYHSKTSVELVKVLCREYWRISPHFKPTTKNFESKIKSNVAGLIIGDRAYQYNSKFKYVFDLSEQWKEYSNLPFVFACWVSKNKLDYQLEKDFNDAINFGLNNLDLALEENRSNFQTSINKKDYLVNIIDYNFDLKKKEALGLFLSLIK